MAEKELIPPIPPRVDTPSLSPDTNKGEEIFRDVYEKSKSNPEFQKILELLKVEMTGVLSGPKGSDLQDFLSNPEIFSNNPVQYQRLFEVLGGEIPDTTYQAIKKVSRPIARQYSEYRDNLLKRNILVNNDATADEGKKTTEERKDFAVIEVKSGGVELGNTVKEAGLLENIKKIKESVGKIKESVGNEWNQKLDAFLQKNDSNELYLSQAKPDKYREQILKNPEARKDYITSIFFLENKDAIKEELQRNINQAPPENKAAFSKKLENFNTEIRALEGMNIIRPVKNIGNELGNNFPPTRPTETARVQAEKLEKTHDVYRDGTSLYFVNKSDPKDIKRIDIYVDRAVYTVMKNGLSLSTDLTLVTHEEKEKREEIRKVETEHEKAEGVYQKTLGEFLPIRTGEYDKKIVGTDKTGIEILRSRGGEGQQYQEMYDTAEQQLMKLTPENTKPGERTTLIQRMREQTEQLMKWNQGFFILKEFGGTEKDIIESDGMKSMLEQRSVGLRNVSQSIEQSEAKKGTLDQAIKGFNLDDTRFDTGSWNDSARGYLSELTGDRIGLNGLSNESFQALLTQFEQRDTGGGIWKEGASLGQDTVGRDNQLRELHSLSQRVGGREGWQRIEKQIRIDGTPPNRAFKGEPGQFQKWIQSLEKPKSDAP